jgi:hypothetical protein
MSDNFQRFSGSWFRDSKRLRCFPADREPVFEEFDPGSDQHPLELGAAAEELLVLCLGAEPHHPLDIGAVVPTPIEEDDLAASG